MAAIVNSYNVYKDGELIAEDLTGAEIQRRYGIDARLVWQCSKSHWQTGSGYTFKLVGEKKYFQNKEREMTEFCREWDKTRLKILKYYGKR